MTLEWNPDFSEHGTEHMLCGYYLIDPTIQDDEDDENEIKIIATVIAHNDGFSWGVQDTYIGPVENGWESTAEAAQQAALKTAEEWEQDE